jgi:hypothetical protein
MVSMPHPRYSPDLVPSDFYLFPTVKERLKHAGITDEDQLFEESTQVWCRFLEKNWKGSFGLGENAFRMPIQAMGATLTHKQFSNTMRLPKCSIKARACTYSPDDI